MKPWAGFGWPTPIKRALCYVYNYRTLCNWCIFTSNSNITDYYASA